MHFNQKSLNLLIISIKNRSLRFILNELALSCSIHFSAMAEVDAAVIGALYSAWQLNEFAKLIYPVVIAPSFLAL